MADRRPVKRLRKAFRRLYEQAALRVRRFSNKTDEVLTETPIDFSAPSIPYYANLAERLSFIRVVLYMILVVFVAVTMITNHRLITYENLYYLAKDISAATMTAQSMADQISYPISSADAEFALFRGGVAVAGSEVVTAMSGSGRQTLSVNVAYADPCVRASDKYCITFGRGESSFSVYNSFVRVYSELTDFPVYDAAVGDNGHFAVVTRSRDYTSEVVLYDGNMEKLASYHLNGYVTGIAMNSEGDRLGVVSMESVNGLWETKITVIRIANRISQSSASVSGSFGSTCGFISEDRFAVVMSDRLMIWGTDATVKGEVMLGEGEPIKAAIGGGRVAILSGDPTDLKTRLLTVYDRNARVSYRLELNGDHAINEAGGADHLAFGDSVLYVRAGERLFRLSGNGNDLTSAAISRDTLSVLPVSGDEVLVCTPAYASRLYAADFAK
jgi:hypothetical protein